MPRLNRLGIVLTLPIVIFLWFVGWSLFWTGSMTRPVKPATVSHQNGLGLEVLITENTLVT